MYTIIYVMISILFFGNDYDFLKKKVIVLYEDVLKKQKQK
jgi:hypothetical protein